MTKKLFFCIAILFFSYASYSQDGNEYAGWIQKSQTFYQAKEYRKSADAFTKAFVSNGGKGFIGDRYNAACSWALAGNKDSAFFQLNRIATKANFTDYDQMTKDADLMSLHTDKRWDALCSLVKQNKDKAEANLNKPLVAILDTVFNDDQGGRMQMGDVQKKYGNNSKEVRELWQTISESDSIDLIKVENILDKYGWLGPDVLGAQGNATIFLVIQHSDIKVQDKYLPIMRKAVENHKANPSDLALLEDRVAMRHGKKQIYGSQILTDINGSFLYPIEDPDNVDKRRATVGLEPLSGYVQNFNLTWNLEDYKKQLPELEKRAKNIH